MQRSQSWFLNYLYGQTTVVLLLASIVTLLNVGCTAESSSKSPAPSVDSSTNSENQSETLKFAVIPSQSQTKQEQQLKSLSDYLEKTLGKPVEFQVTKDYKSAVDLLVEGKVEIAYLGPLTYIQARSRTSQIEPIVAPINKLTGRPWYTSVIIGNSGKGIKTLEDLKGKRFGFVSQSSTSGYLVATSQFKKIGINPQQDFTEVKYLGSHDKSVAALASGVVDAVSVEKEAYRAGEESGQLNSNYSVIWESDPIPTPPIVISNKMSPQLTAQLKKALINAPEGLLDITGTESAGYTLVEDADYEPIRQIQKSLEAKSNQAK